MHKNNKDRKNREKQYSNLDRIKANLLISFIPYFVFLTSM